MRGAPKKSFPSEPFITFHYDTSWAYELNSSKLPFLSSCAHPYPSSMALTWVLQFTTCSGISMSGNVGVIHCQIWKWEASIRWVAYPLIIKSTNHLSLFSRHQPTRYQVPSLAQSNPVWAPHRLAQSNPISGSCIAGLKPAWYKLAYKSPFKSQVSASQHKSPIVPEMSTQNGDPVLHS